METNIINGGWQLYSNLTLNMPPALFSFLLRSDLLLLCPIVVAYAGFSYGLRSPKLQTVLMSIGVLVAISIPLPNSILNRSPLRPWITLISILWFWYGPIVLSWLATPQFGHQRRLLRTCRLLLFALLVLNIIFWC